MARQGVIQLPQGFDTKKLTRRGDPVTSLLAAQQASKASVVAINEVAHLMVDGQARIDEEIWADCRRRGFKKEAGTIRHARLALSDAALLVWTGRTRTTSNSCQAREWIWIGSPDAAEACKAFEEDRDPVYLADEE